MRTLERVELARVDGAQLGHGSVRLLAQLAQLGVVALASLVQRSVLCRLDLGLERRVCGGERGRVRVVDRLW